MYVPDLFEARDLLHGFRSGDFRRLLTLGQNHVLRRASLRPRRTSLVADDFGDVADSFVPACS